MYINLSIYLFTCHKAAVNEAAGARLRVISPKGGQALSADHDGRPLALQLDLAQQARDLAALDIDR